MLKLSRSALALAITVLATQQTQASVVFDIQEVGSNVVMIAEGSVNTDVLSKNSNGADGNRALFSTEPLAFFVQGGDSDIYWAIYEIPEFYSEEFETNDSYGDTFGLFGPFVLLPDDYISGGTIRNVSVFFGETLESLGLIEGQYAGFVGPFRQSVVSPQSVGNGNTLLDGDTPIIFNVGDGNKLIATPLPAALPLLAASIGGLMLLRRRTSRET